MGIISTIDILNDLQMVSDMHTECAPNAHRMHTEYTLTSGLIRNYWLNVMCLK